MKPVRQISFQVYFFNHMFLFDKNRSLRITVFFSRGIQGANNNFNQVGKRLARLQTSIFHGLKQGATDTKLVYSNHPPLRYSWTSSCIQTDAKIELTAPSNFGWNGLKGDPGNDVPTNPGKLMENVLEGSAFKRTQRLFFQWISMCFTKGSPTCQSCR